MGIRLWMGSRMTLPAGPIGFGFTFSRTGARLTAPTADEVR